MDNTNDIKLFLYGGCDLHDIVDTPTVKKHFKVINCNLTGHIDNVSLDFNNATFPSMGTSLISLYSKPGPIAQRVLETLSTGQKRDIIINRETYNEILKFPMLSFYKKYVGPNDYLLLSFSPEIYTKLLKSGECFTCLPTMRNLANPDHCLHWLHKEYFKNEDFLLAFDTKESLEWSFDLMVDFARDIYEIFQDRVILVKSHFSNFAITDNHQIKNVNFGPRDLLYYKQTKIITDPLDLNYTDRLSKIIMNKFRHHYKSDLSLIQLNEPVFLDANHRWGFGQFHIDMKSRDKLAKLVCAEILKKNLKYE
jgi:hypothetical protein